MNIIANIILRLGFGLLILQISRLVFLLYSWGVYQNHATLALASSFVIGLRYDIFALTYMLLPFFLLSLLSSFSFFRSKEQSQLPHPIFEFFCRFVFLLGVGTAIGLNLADAKYSQFSKHRLSFSLLFQSDDTAEHTQRMIFQFWDVALITIVLLMIIYGFFPKFKIFPFYENIKKHHYKTVNVSIFSVFLMLIPFSMRGGFEPLNYTYSFSQNADAALSVLRINTVFSIVHSWKYAAAAPYDDVPKEAVEAIRKQNIYADSVEYPQQNVVVFILESCAAEYMGLYNKGTSYTPFMDSLAKEGQYFEQAFANGSTSIEGFPSVLMSIPSLMNNAMGYTFSKDNHYSKIGDFAREKGYFMGYFHGAKNGSMNFNKMSESLGIEYFGRNEYPNPKADFDGTWGIWDEDYFLYVAKEMTQKNKPFVSTIFSITAHEPHTIPSKYEGKLLKGKLPVYQAIAYTDRSLKSFFEYAKKQAWYNQTLFIITADHTSLSVLPEFKQKQLGKFKVPLMLYHPQGKYPNIDAKKVVQHCDILPSILDYLEWESLPISHIGESFFKPSEGKAICYENGKYYFIRPHYYVEMIDQQATIRNHQDQILPPKTNHQTDISNLKAYRQYYLENMKENRW
ncbi:MAG: LTA synthase family protein [Bacteroidia bacterium]